MRRQQQLRVADAASQAEHARARAGAGDPQDPLRHVRPQRTDRGTRKMRLRESGIEFLVVRQLALNLWGSQSWLQQAFSRLSPSVKTFTRLEKPPKGRLRRISPGQ